MNKTAIAVAADSAVTRGTHKVHATANKIFRISNSAPVGMMVYGNADVFDIPWEVLAKLFRTEMGDKTFKTISEWSGEFRKFLFSEKFIGGEIPKREIGILAFYLASSIEERCTCVKKIPLSREIEEEIFDLKNKLLSTDDIQNYNAPSERQFVKDYGVYCIEIIQEIFEGRPISNRVKKQFPELVRMFSKSKMSSDYMSGFVIFGFGDSEMFPSLSSYIIDGAPYGIPRILDETLIETSRKPSDFARIIAFARGDTSQLFMEDVSGRTKSFFLRSIKSSLKGFGKKIFDEFEKSGKISEDEKKVYMHMFSKEVDDFSGQFQEELQRFIHKNSTNPIISALDGLGLEDMAKLAESLVELASLKLRYSKDVEVVGGPIDVAVLSKTDGFIWIKRKHYFDPELNLHFVQRYNKGKPKFMGA